MRHHVQKSTTAVDLALLILGALMEDCSGASRAVPAAKPKGPLCVQRGDLAGTRANGGRDAPILDLPDLLLERRGSTLYQPLASPRGRQCSTYAAVGCKSLRPICWVVISHQYIEPQGLGPFGRLTASEFGVRAPSVATGDLRL